MKFLLTGGLGFIGHHVYQILEKDYDVTSVDCIETYCCVPKKELDFLVKQRTRILKEVNNKFLDIRDSDLYKVLDETSPNVVIHLAAFPRAKVVNINPTWASNVLVTGLLNLLEACKTSRVDRFVYISSSMVYGDFTGAIDETYPCNPKGLYGILKLTGEQIVKDYCTQNNIEYVIIRPSAVYGPRDVLDRVVSKFFYNAAINKPLIINGLDEKLDFSYVNDVAHGIVQASLVGRSAGKTYNLTRGHARKILTAAELVRSMVLDCRSEIQIQSKNNIYPSRGTLDCSRAEQDFNFNPSVDIEQGFKYYYDWCIHSQFFENINS